MNSTKSLLFCSAIPSLFCRTLRDWNKNSCLFARRINYMEKPGLAKMACLLLVFCAVTTIVSPAQTFSTLVDFNGTDGANPSYVSLVQGTDGNLYGTTSGGGANSDGTVSKITPTGTLTTLYSFCSQTNCADGSIPEGGLVQGSDGNFYGTTNRGGAGICTEGCGTIFKITPKGTLTTLHAFCPLAGFACPDGSYPEAALVQGTDGNFYGTTFTGGCVTQNRFECVVAGEGTVFKITPQGTLTHLYTFCSASGCTDGAYPVAGLVQGTDGNFYGTTYQGGGLNSGTVFKITPAGALTTLYSFCSQTNCTDGSTPYGALVQGTDGNFYGTTSQGGTHTCGDPFGDVFGCGTVFKITPAGTLTTLYNFCSQTNCTDGSGPSAGLVQATDGNFYGTASVSGDPNCGTMFTFGCGTVFKITPAGTLTALYSFQASTDGAVPYGGLVQATNGNFYGTTNVAGDPTCNGDQGCGSIFSESVGLGAFVETRPTSGPEGAKIGILGQGFTSSSVVKFGGVQAETVTVTGTTFLKATVPAGALTGPVTVTTGATKLTSNHTFHVMPQVKSFTPSDGPEGTVVTITGTGLKQTRTVTFDGVKAAAHTVESDTEVKATVPTGAKTGKIAITTLGGTGTSAASFTVTE